MKVLRILLSTVGSWPKKALGEQGIDNRFFAAWLTFQAFVVTCGMINYIIENLEHLTFFDLGDVYSTLFLSCVTTFRAILPATKRYGVIVKSFLTSFHLIHYTDQGEYNKNMYNKINNFSGYFTYFLMAWSFGGLTLFNVSPILNNYKHGMFSENKPENGSYQFSIYYTYFGFNQDDRYIQQVMINYIISYQCGFLVIAIDTLLFIMIFNLIGHIKILDFNIRHMDRPKNKYTVELHDTQKQTKTQLFVERFNEEENILITRKLGEFVNYHRLIMNFTDEISNFFGPMLGLNYLYHLLCGCLLLLECSQMDAESILRYGPLTVHVIFAQLMMTSIIFEVVGTESEKLKDAVFDMPWECMSVGNQRCVRIFLIRIQTPIRVTAMGMVDVGVETMTAVLKTTLTYFAFLKSIRF